MNERKTCTKILIIGAGGMLGSAMFRFFSKSVGFYTVGTLRSSAKSEFFLPMQKNRIICDVDVQSEQSLNALFEQVQPDVVINCVGIIKQIDAAKSHLMSLSINSLLPHQLAEKCREYKARFIHFSTDCVFSGDKGMYLESDFPDANDLYGRSKYLGEVDYTHSITLRTSIIGHELSSSNSLIEWFLSQNEAVCGFNKAIFSGLPAVEISRIVRDYVLPNPKLHGLYHVSADPIDKYSLLVLVAKVYQKNLEIIPDETVVINRSLNSNRFRGATGFIPDSWPILISKMYGISVRNEEKNV